MRDLKTGDSFKEIIIGAFWTMLVFMSVSFFLRIVISLTVAKEMIRTCSTIVTL